MFYDPASKISTGIISLGLFWIHMKQVIGNFTKFQFWPVLGKTIKFAVNKIKNKFPNLN